MIQERNKEVIFEFLSRPEMEDFWRDIDGELIGPQEDFNEVPATILWNGRVMFMFDPPWSLGGTLYSGVHFAADKDSRGNYAIECGKKAIARYFELLPDVDSLVCAVFADRPNHQRFCEKLGMLEYNRNDLLVNYEVKRWDGQH